MRSRSPPVSVEMVSVNPVSLRTAAGPTVEPRATAEMAVVLWVRTAARARRIANPVLPATAVTVYAASKRTAGAVPAIAGAAAAAGTAFVRHSRTVRPAPLIAKVVRHAAAITAATRRRKTVSLARRIVEVTVRSGLVRLLVLAGSPPDGSRHRVLEL